MCCFVSYSTWPSWIAFHLLSSFALLLFLCTAFFRHLNRQRWTDTLALREQLLNPVIQPLQSSKEGCDKESKKEAHKEWPHLGVRSVTQPLQTVNWLIASSIICLSLQPVLRPSNFNAHKELFPLGLDHLTISNSSAEKDLLADFFYFCVWPSN